MRFSLLSRFMVVAALFPAAAMFADGLQTFQLSGSYAYKSTTPQGYASGTITIDTTTGTVENVDLSYTGLDEPYLDTFVLPGTSSIPFTEINEFWAEPPLDEAQTSIGLILPVESLVGYDGGSICSVATPCYFPDESWPTYSGQGSHSGTTFINGQLTPVSDVSAVSPTPEPSSLALLGTGVLGVLGVMRRRWQRA